MFISSQRNHQFPREKTDECLHGVELAWKKLTTQRLLNILGGNRNLSDKKIKASDFGRYIGDFDMVCESKEHNCNSERKRQRHLDTFGHCEHYIGDIAI